MKESIAGKTILFVALVVVGLMVIGPTIATAQDATTTYYDNATPGYDAKIRIINPTGGDLWANVYVSDNGQELIECCSCFVSGTFGEGLRTLSVNVDLTANPANGKAKTNGVITIVGGPAFGAGKPYAAAPGLKTFATHVQYFGGSLVQTETNGQNFDVTGDLTYLQTTCNSFANLSGAGICSCGYGD
jgi:hypothetical protein